MTASGIIDTFLNRPCNAVVLNPTNDPLSLAKYHPIATELPFPSAIKQNKSDDPYPYISSPPPYDSVYLVCHQTHPDRLQKMTSNEQITQKDEAKLTEDWRNEISIPNKYIEHKE